MAVTENVDTMKWKEEVAVRKVAKHISRRVEKLMLRQGLLSDAVENAQNDQPFLAELYKAAVSGRVLSGPRSSQQATRVGNLDNDHGREEKSSACCVNVDGVGLHANTVIPAHDRMRLERTLRYMCRPHRLRLSGWNYCPTADCFIGWKNNGGMEQAT